MPEKVAQCLLMIDSPVSKINRIATARGFLPHGLSNTCPLSPPVFYTAVAFGQVSDQPLMFWCIDTC